MRRSSLTLVVVLALAGCGSAGESGTGPETATASTTTATAQTSRTVRTIATGLSVPWGIAFLPDGSALVTERTTGRIKAIPRQGGRARTVMRIPEAAGGGGEGGLLGLAVSPHYAQDRLLYAYVTTASDNRVVRFRLGGRVEPILTGIRRGAIHNGGRIAFGPDGKLYVSTGETGDRALAQQRDSLNGKILRIDPDGSTPGDNPFGTPVWSLGHRNVQGLAWDRRGRLWATEFGQDTTDEVNLIRKGGNYGWPVVEGRGTGGGRFVAPKVTWSPTNTSSPSGLAYARGALYVGALQGHAVFKVRLHGASAGRPQKQLAGRLGRIRTVARAPDGSLWVATSNRDGRGTPRSGDDRIVRYGG